MTPEHDRPQEQPGKYPLEVKILQPDLIFEQAATVSKRVKSGQYVPVGEQYPLGKDFFVDIEASFIVNPPATEIGIPDGGFTPRIEFSSPLGAINRSEGQVIIQRLRAAGYHDADFKYQENPHLIDLNSDRSSVEMSVGDNRVHVYLGLLGKEEATARLKNDLDATKARPEYPNKTKHIANLEKELEDPLLENHVTISVSKYGENKKYKGPVPLTDARSLEDALVLNGKVAQEVHAIINEIKGVQPTPKTLIIKPEAMGADTRVAEALAKTDAPISRELALPQETTFEQIAGYPDEVENLRDIAFMLEKHDPNAPKGILFYGPPGTGKTIMAEAFAHECRDFATFTPLEMGGVFTAYMHESAKNLRRFLQEAQKKTHEEKKSLAIVFLDELDAVATTVEGARPSASTEDRREVRKVLLEWLDGVRDIKNPWDTVPVFIVGASNFKEVLDEALLRSGRIDEHIFLGEPRAHGLADIMKLKASKLDYVDHDIDWEQLSLELEGISGADVEALFKKAYRRAVVRSRRIGDNPRKISLKDLQEVAPDIVASRKRLKEEIKEKGPLGFNTRR